MAIFTDVFEDVTKQGRKIATSDYCETGLHPIIDQGQSTIAGYTNETDGLFRDVPAIIFGDHTRVLKYVDTPCFLGADGVKLLKAKIQNPNYKYLYYVLSSANIPNTGYNRHFKWLKEVEIPLPSEVEQQKIADTLDKINELIALRKEQLAKLDQLVKSRFIELFGDLASPHCTWETKKLVDTCVAADDIKCGPFGTQLSKDEYVDSGVAVWEIPQINSLFATLPTHYLTEEKAKELDAYSIKAGDIAMSRKGNVGKCAVFPLNFASGIIHSDVLRIRVDGSQVLPLFMMHQLHYSGSVHHQIELVSAGAIMAGINVTKLKQISVHIPPMHLQQQFVAFVEQTDKSKLAIQQSLDKLELLKKTLMQEYFG